MKRDGPSTEHRGPINLRSMCNHTGEALIITKHRAQLGLLGQNNKINGLLVRGKGASR